MHLDTKCKYFLFKTYDTKWKNNDQFFYLSLSSKHIYVCKKTIPIGIDIMEIMKHTYIGNKI